MSFVRFTFGTYWTLALALFSLREKGFILVIYEEYVMSSIFSSQLKHIDGLRGKVGTYSYQKWLLRRSEEILHRHEPFDVGMNPSVGINGGRCEMKITKLYNLYYLSWVCSSTSMPLETWCQAVVLNGKYMMLRCYMEIVHFWFIHFTSVFFMS